MSKRERDRLLALALVLLAVLLVVGGVLYYRATIRPAQQMLVDTMRTQQAEAGQTAVRESQLTRAAR